jgi:predicted ATPase
VWLNAGQAPTSVRLARHPNDAVGQIRTLLGGHRGRIREALVTINQALASADRGGERYYYPELLRIKGELLFQDATAEPVSAPEDCFRAALDAARQQRALFWELRGALSLARLRVTEGCRNGAKAILAPIYDQFTEGFETADLRAARDILNTPSS